MPNARRTQKRLAEELAARCRALQQAGLDPAAAERRAFDEFCARDPGLAAAWPNVYQEFVEGHAPGLRRARGVFYTPHAVVRAQVRLAADVLRHGFECAQDFADARVRIVDPATGSGAYPLAILELLRQRGAADSLPNRLWLFETLPGAAAMARAQGLPVLECDALTSSIALDVPIAVCIGNPPYRRQTGRPATSRWLDGFVGSDDGIHRKNLHNEYVYFWRWALANIFERRDGPGMVNFVTAASYVRGPAFGAMRHLMRRTLDELWIIDLEGDHLAARSTDNVFPIRTPVAIGIGVRYARTRPDHPASVHYTRVCGPSAAKLAHLERVQSVTDLAWEAASDDWTAPFNPPPASAYAGWPRLTELFPWQVSGAQLKRTWPIGPTREALRERWSSLLAASGQARAVAFRETRDRTLDSAPQNLLDPRVRLAPLRQLEPDVACLEPLPYAYRSFDRQYVLPDARLGDFMRPALWRVYGPRQIFLTSLLTNVLGPGPAVVATTRVPDLDHFRGSFGARGVIPLWCDAAATRPNVAAEWLARLEREYGCAVSPEELLAYCYALLGTRGYVARFEDELRTPGPRVPLTRNPDLFRRAAQLGEQLLQVHTYRSIERGHARCLRPIGTAPPDAFAYEPTHQTLHVGDGAFGPVAPEVWAYAVSGLKVVASWVRHRLPRTCGSSPLDAIGLRAWTPQLSTELVELVWLVESTLALEPKLDALLEEVVSGGVC